MKPSAVLVTILLGGCDFGVGRADQDNFTIHASKQRAERFAQNLATEFDSTIDPQDVNGLGNEPSRMFWLEGRDANLVITPIPDDRCNPNAPSRSTFNRGEYRIDLFYRSTTKDARNAAKRKLVHAAEREALKITEFKEC